MWTKATFSTSCIKKGEAVDFCFTVKPFRPNSNLTLGRVYFYLGELILGIMFEMSFRCILCFDLFELRWCKVWSEGVWWRLKVGLLSCIEFPNDRLKLNFIYSG